MRQWAFLWAVSAVLTAGTAVQAARRDQPGAIEMSQEEWKKLDSFEANRLAKADQTFMQGARDAKQYRAAEKDYDAFLAEFPKSKAVPYALLRKAQCLQGDDKRFKAIEAYTEVLDYFPNNIPYAAPALFKIGECHKQNGDLEKAMKHWLEMATDKDYRQHVLAAVAVNELADNLMRQEKAAEAVKYYEQVALDFRDSNPDPAANALDQVFRYYIVDQPNDLKLRELYKNAGTFDRRPHRIAKTANVEEDRRYWQQVWNRVDREGQSAFGKMQESQKKRFYGYWAKAFSGKFPEWEEFQIKTAEYQRNASGDAEAWYKAMDALFAKGYKAGNVDRVFKWIEYYGGHKRKIMEYCGKLDYKTLKMHQVDKLVSITQRDGLAWKIFNDIYKNFDFEKLSNDDIKTLAMIVYHRFRNMEMGRNTIMKVKLFKLDDDQKSALAKSLARIDGFVVRHVCLAFEDKNRGKFELVTYYYGAKKNAPPGLEIDAVLKERMDLASQLTGVDEYAQESWWMKAEFLKWDKKYPEALASYRNSDKAPDCYWAIAECFELMGKLEQAVQQLVEIENFVKGQQARACLAIADVYHRAKRQKEEIGALRQVMKKYPKSNESSSAHQRLEKLGVKIGGAVDAD